ncbi:ninjurin-1 [Drosophila obscura]|uniref:ninjurin-1 n=1 Tax=Drosophila obscura TaxID=7282 RepID=UPI001BB14CED|nr:ninjurin-1 [Drosophila obscura]
MDSNDVELSLQESPSSEGSFSSTAPGQCCSSGRDFEKAEGLVDPRAVNEVEAAQGKPSKSGSDLSGGNSYATNKNVAEGLMDIALLSANANQLRFLITYNDKASTYIYSLILVALSLSLQLLVGLMMIFKRRLKRCQHRRYARTNELLVMGVFMITVINILLAAFTTTDGNTH